MFVLSELKDVVRIPPWKFKRKLNDAIADELNRKLANKVYLNVGLCIALHDITKIEESYIFPGDGSSHTKVTFRFIVFRPFMEEVLLGKIRSCSADGVHGNVLKCNLRPISSGRFDHRATFLSVMISLIKMTLGFFEDIIIPPHKLQHPSRFDQTEQAWVWEYDAGDGQKHDLFMDAGEVIRFRVVSESFVETLPTGPVVPGEGVEKPEASGISPYTLGAAIDEPGLGLLTWWENT